MKKLFIKIFDKIIIMLLSIISVFTSCKPASDFYCESYPIRKQDPMPVMYGVISAHYVIKGTVMDNANSQPIPNIQISTNCAGTSYTYLNGQYEFSCSDVPNKENVIHLKFEDIDGKENGGHFKTKEIDIKITDADKKKIDNCVQNNGFFVKIQNVELKKKP